MKGFKHKNVLCMLAITFKKDLPCVILPFMENGDLKTFLGKEDRVSKETIDALKQNCKKIFNVT